ncbi:putative ABC transport system ATP-binding protein [Pseudoclavibacter sp. JAI123]|uniref:ABC transporter ATP-binding protein n=1 Tax=Pseudoclavibacter sp. JAI123 TaxID=2723065 RepID=UPI0015C80F10|nr:ABC transporter ATP-binding protein [Pseudoclavibacter sp. JAI123]NYF12560.1 putative ABC transport system ATP-binding protein [Pseudoclavibacter sp. JAI123]
MTSHPGFQTPAAPRPGAQTSTAAGAHHPGAVLAAHSLTKTYGATVALAGVSLAVRAGEALAIMGASGSGKTTLLHSLAGIITPDSGSIQLHAEGGSREMTDMSEAQRTDLRRTEFGFVFQEGMLLPELTALENVALAAMLCGVERKRAEHAAGEWLAAMGLRGMEARRIGELSGGQAQRVAIARAQVTGARIVFADEPTGALDSATSSDVMTALLAATSRAGRSLVVVTHDPEVAARCDRTVRMRDGRVLDDSAARA